MTPAEEMTAAAALMRERAEKAAAAPGAWSYGDERVRAGNCPAADMYAPLMLAGYALPLAVARAYLRTEGNL